MLKLLILSHKVTELNGLFVSNLQYISVLHKKNTARKGSVNFLISLFFLTFQKEFFVVS